MTFPFSDNFYSAVSTLAGPGSLKKRLISAYAENLDPMPKFDIPESIRPQFESLWRAMHSVKPTSTESSVVASVRKMSTADATWCASIIVTMFSELVRDKVTGEPLRLTRGLDSEISVDTEQGKASRLN